MPQRYSMAKRAEATGHTRARIEAALIRLLGSRPYDGITMIDIAAQADVAVRTVQRHYTSRDNVLAACVGFPTRALADELSRRPPASSPRAALRDLVQALFSFYEANSEQVWAVYSRAQDAPVMDELRRATIRARESLIDALIERWPDSWSTHKRTARAAVLGLTAFGTWRALTNVGRFPPQDAVKFILGVLERSLLK